MKVILAIGAGSFIGGIARYLTSLWVQSKFSSVFPYGTLVVNIAGCLLIGLVFGIFERGAITAEWRLFLATGILGGFTTYSAFAMETVNLLRNSDYMYAVIYVIASIIAGVLASVAGYALTKIA